MRGPTLYGYVHFQSFVQFAMQLFALHKKDFKTASEMQQATATSFSDLLAQVAIAQPQMRIRFSTSNPQDMTEEVLYTVSEHPNICNHIHLPFQSGSTRILKEMNRQHTREEYLALVKRINEIIPNCSISQDIIVGFPTETEEDHQDTLSLMEAVKFNFGYMYKYSERPGTMAARKFEDDIPEETKKRRLTEIVAAQRSHGDYRTNQFVGKTTEILIEQSSKKSDQHWSGRNPQSVVAVFPKEQYQPGDLVTVLVEDCTSATLIGKAVGYAANQ